MMMRLKRLIEDLFNESNLKREALLGEKKRKIEEDKEKAVELRQQSLETFAETN